MTSQTETRVWTGLWTAAVGAVLFIFLAATIGIGIGGYLTNPGANLIVPIGVTAVAPVALFLAAFAASARFRGFCISARFAHPHHDTSVACRRVHIFAALCLRHAAGGVCNSGGRR